jgi:uncharacterized protein (TIGR03790 family)
MSTDIPRAKGWFLAACAVALLCGVCGPAAAALEPDQIALVINKNVPASRELAEFYAQKRGIPAGRMIELDLPFPDEEMFFSRYNEQVVPAVRTFLHRKGLKDKVTCLVTFWGVPLRIGRRTATPAENEQLRIVQAEQEKVRAELQAAVAQAEALAKELDSSFSAGQGNEPAQLAKRGGDALTVVVRSVLPMPPGERRARAVERLVALFDKLMGDAETAQRLASPELAGLSSERVTPERAGQVRRQADEWMRQVKELQSKPPSPQTQAAMRTLVRDHFGLFRYQELLNSQYAASESKETEAAFDSELSLVWWDNYPRFRWQPNALNCKVRSVPPGTPPTLMVMRLDGPTEQSVDRIILSSLKAEKEGLKGQVALDGRGNRTDDGYGRYDATIRRLAELLRSKTKLTVTFDDREPLFQPGPGALKDVAVYCGWYSLRNYVPAFKFSEGAVGFHVASSELVSLRTPGEKGWVHGLINDGVAATLGPVAEPYLHSFPPADELFPLLMTGELTLAEVYWKTTPLTSWMNTCIGDPLYRPYKVNPPLDLKDLPDNLRAVFVRPHRASSGPATAPTTRPAEAGR